MMKKYFRSERLWPLSIIAAMAAFIAIVLAFVTIAMRHQPQLVSEHAYAEGYNLREIAKRKSAGDATGWSIQARVLPVTQANMPLVEFNVTEKNGTPADSLRGEAGFYRPSNQALDRSALPLQFVGQGRYLVFLPKPLELGAWQTVLHVARGQQELSQRIDLMAAK